MPQSELSKRHQDLVDFLGEMDCQVPQAVPASTVATAKTAGPVPSAAPAKTEHPVLKENQDQEAKWAHKAFVAGAALPAPRASLALVASRGPKEVPAATVFKAPPARVANPVKMAAMESPLFCPANQVLPALPEGMAVPVSTATLAFPAKMVGTERTVCEGAVAKRAFRDLPALAVRMVKMADLVRWAAPARMASTARTVETAATVSTATPACLVGTAAMVATVHLEKSAPVVKRVTRVTPDPKVLPELRAPVVPRVTKATPVLKALVAPKVLRGHAAKLEPTARMVSRQDNLAVHLCSMHLTRL